MATPFQVEAWTEYAIGLLVLLIRIVYRTRLVGTNWEGDDYFAAIAVLFWTGELLMLEMIGEDSVDGPPYFARSDRKLTFSLSASGRYGSITGMSDAIALTLSDQQKQSIVIGSKCLLAGWVLYVTLIWCLKACMLFLYMRLTYDSPTSHSPCGSLADVLVDGK
ncbi:Kinesin-like protein [Colletotrichum scovillei]|uniref:Kinesin-like protein n=1 Tax=Colletotrichum scovillei TaxID=1209932 RepID=A0A9P7REG9_9PEZI|nr:Kinesin-like protein [Colletotrichum scovillei]KAG7075232.1 Kinesin-like protein [Colletotrichum scovillei]KAG7082230.1 Kinesin-like protein [Colletotrichum scovillei]